ncbi:hypothetical protein Tco_0612444 [Tanacetum coccineum]
MPLSAPMIQPEPEDLPKDNPKLEIESLGGDKVLCLECKLFTWSLRVQGGDKEAKQSGDKGVPIEQIHESESTIDSKENGTEVILKEREDWEELLLKHSNDTYFLIILGVGDD